MSFPVCPRLRPLVLVALAACGAPPQPPAVEREPVRADSPRIAVEQAPLLSPALADSARQQIRSVRTSLEDCALVSVDEEGGGSTQRCRGTAGYTLLALDGDSRMSITVITPAGAEQPLEFWTNITGGFSSLGPSAEWRVRGQGAAAVPIALIVGLNANEDPENPERVTRYRIISRLSAAGSCVIHSLPGTTPDAEVRRLADASPGQPCIKPYSERE